LFIFRFLFNLDFRAEPLVEPFTADTSRSSSLVNAGALDPGGYL